MEEFNGGKALAMNMNRGMLQDLGNTNPEGKKEIDFREVENKQNLRELAQ